MGATYLSLQLRTTDRNVAVAALTDIAAANVGSGMRFCVTETLDEWLKVFTLTLYGALIQCERTGANITPRSCLSVTGNLLKFFPSYEHRRQTCTDFDGLV